MEKEAVIGTIDHQGIQIAGDWARQDRNIGIAARAWFITSDPYAIDDAVDGVRTCTAMRRRAKAVRVRGRPHRNDRGSGVVAWVGVVVACGSRDSRHVGDRCRLRMDRRGYQTRQAGCQYQHHPYDSRADLPETVRSHLQPPRRFRGTGARMCVGAVLRHVVRGLGHAMHRLMLHDNESLPDGKRLRIPGSVLRNARGLFPPEYAQRCVRNLDNAYDHHQSRFTHHCSRCVSFMHGRA